MNRFGLMYRLGFAPWERRDVERTWKPLLEGPEAYRGKTALAIYEFDADHLIWCPAEPGREERLRAFPPMDDMGHLCIIFKREKKEG